MGDSLRKKDRIAAESDVRTFAAAHSDAMRRIAPRKFISRLGFVFLLKG